MPVHPLLKELQVLVRTALGQLPPQQLKGWARGAVQTNLHNPKPGLWHQFWVSMWPNSGQGTSLLVSPGKQLPSSSELQWAALRCELPIHWNQSEDKAPMRTGTHWAGEPQSRGAPGTGLSQSYPWPSSQRGVNPCPHHWSQPDLYFLVFAVKTRFYREVIIRKWLSSIKI